jgi:hypothetical protein
MSETPAGVLETINALGSAEGVASIRKMMRASDEPEMDKLLRTLAAT